MQVIRWLEEYLTSKDVSAVVVTHDRAFMESVCTSVLELEHGEVHTHNFGGPGSYERFREVCGQHLFSSDHCWAQHCTLIESMLPSASASPQVSFHESWAVMRHHQAPVTP